MFITGTSQGLKTFQIISNLTTFWIAHVYQRTLLTHSGHRGRRFVTAFSCHHVELENFISIHMFYLTVNIGPGNGLNPEYVTTSPEDMKYTSNKKTNTYVTEYNRDLR